MAKATLWDADLNRRTQASLEDGSTWVYHYNDRSELTGGGRFWYDGSPVAGQQYGYGYDHIGNRTAALSGGDTNGVNLRRTGYAVNSLNQYTNVTTPGYEDIVGLAFATNSVTVNTLTADRKVEFFHREITVANGSGPVWCGVTVTSGGSSSNGGFVFPAYQQTNTYDLDGNLTFDGVWAYEWDGENRLRAMTMTNVSGVANAQRKRLEFAYDSEGRRVGKLVQQWNGSSFTAVSTNRFVYDGWNLIAVLDPANVIVQSFLWGQDLSGTRTEAGGIGGFLAVVDHNASGAVMEAHFCSYDGNGNITALTKASDYQTTARYEYSPFGEFIRATGQLAKLNPFTFSARNYDWEAELLMYLERPYSPRLGRWLSRDPIGEEGGLNLYAFVGNNPINLFDPFGMSSGTLVEEEAAGGTSAGMAAQGGVRLGGFLKRAENLVNTLEDFYELADVVMDAAQGDPTDLLVQLWETRADVMKSRGKPGAQEIHHYLPQNEKMKNWFLDKAGLDVEKFKGGMSKAIHRRLHKGKGFGRGGIWNGLWNMYLERNADTKTVDPKDVEKFAKAMSRFFGLE